MDRIRQIWISSQAGNHNEPLRTSHTYDDDEIFLGTARHLLSSSTTSCCQDMTRQQRHSFLEGLRVRQKQLDVLAPHVASAVQSLQARPEIEQTLAALALGEGGDVTNTTYSSVQSIHHRQHHQHHPNKPEAPNKSKRSRRFFPSSSFDGDSIGSGSAPRGVPLSSAFYNRRRVQNIDLCEAVEQMQLGDGAVPPPAGPQHSFYHQQNHNHHQHQQPATAAPGFF